MFLWYVTLNVVGQLPKRLFFRNRPWRKNVAKKLSKDQSSSFPSRSTLFILCATYSFCLLGGVPVQDSLVYLVMVAIPISHSRIFLGAHYFSDCIAGILLVLPSLTKAGVTCSFFHLSYQSQYLGDLLGATTDLKA